MKSVAVFFAFAVGWFFITSAPLHAQTDDDVMAAYKAYNAAIEAGEDQAAFEQAKRAYELAEAVWGDSRQETALLAINYADRLFDRKEYKDAVKIYARCIELLQEQLENSRFNLGYCYYQQGTAFLEDGRKNKAEAAYLSTVETLSPLTDSDLDAAAYVGQAYLALAGLNAPKRVRASSPDVGARRLAQLLEQSRDYAKKAQPLLIRALGEEAFLVGYAYLVEAYYYEWAREWNTARDLYKKALDIFEKHLGTDHIETRRALGRHLYADALARREDENPEEAEDKALKEKNEMLASGCSTVERDGVEIEICIVKRRAPIFPMDAAYNGQSGFAFIEFDIDETGAVVNPRIIESWPGEEFDRATLSAMKRWRYKPPVTADGTVVFVTDIETFVRFDLEW